ncbi:MAG: hypothetical protein ACOYKJ_04805 [Candidatus Howiella sp.]
MKKMVSFLLAGTLVISCFAFPASAAIIDGDGGVFDANDAYSGLIDGDGPIIDGEDDFPDTIAQPVIDKIAALGEITSLDQKTDVEAARAAYDILTDLQKSYVSNYATLQDAEAKIVDLTAAKGVIDTIAALGTVTLEKEDDVKAARTAYDALTDAQKALVTNYETLTAAEQKIIDLKAEEADKAAAKAVTDQIAALGEITSLDQEDDVKAARTAYDALTDAQKALVTNYETLTAAEQKIVDLKAEEADKAAAKAVEDQIAALGEITSLDQEDDVKAVRAAYDALTDAQKALVSADNLKTLTDAEAKIEELRVKLGDVDGDGKVTVSDVVELRKLIVAGSSTDREFAAGNLDDTDAILTVSDVVALRALIVAGA